MPSDNEVKAELELGEPPQELLDWAKREIGENPETRCQVISDFRDMIFGRYLVFHFKIINSICVKLSKFLFE